MNSIGIVDFLPELLIIILEKLDINDLFLMSC